MPRFKQVGLLLVVLLCAGCSQATEVRTPPPASSNPITTSIVAGRPDTPSATTSTRSASAPAAQNPGSASSAPAAQPIVDGARLIDATSEQPWVPRGVNYPSFGYACAQGWGTSSSSAQDGAGAATAEAIASWGANVVRLPLNQDCWNATNEVTAEYAGDNYQLAVLTFVQQLNAAGLAVIIDLHSRKTDGPSTSGQRAMPDMDSITFFSSVAATFADNPSVMFDAFNEPYSRYDDAHGKWALELDWTCWRNGGCQAPIEDDYTETLTGQTFEVVGMAQLVTAIRQAGASQPVMVAGLDYANDLREWLTNRPDDQQLVASIHSYQGQRCADVACWTTEVGPVADQAPVIFGEFGATSGTMDGNVGYLTSLMNWADSAGVGYVIWAWWVLDDEPGPDAFALLSSDDGTPRAPVGTTFHDHLAAVQGG